MKKIGFVKENKLFIVLLIIFIIIKVLALLDLGYDYSINSDDLSYINSGITFYESGKITMHGVTSAQIMPGLTYLIAFLCLFFGTGSGLLIALKILYLIFSVISIIVLYKISLLFANKYISALICLLLMAPDYIWLNNLILTETPFILILLLLIYYSLLFLRNHRNKDFYLILLFYILGIFIRPNIIIFPIALIICLIIQKYNKKELLKKCLIGLAVVVLSLLPWIIRNYQVFDKFIPLTYGSGNPLLLGTYQGVGYPEDEELDYKTNVAAKMPKEMQKYLNEDYPRDKYKVYYSLEYDKMKALYRISYWWEHDKISLLKSYLIYKPKIMLYSTFYWDEVFNIDIKVNLVFRIIDLIMFIISSILIILKRKHIPEFLFLIILYGMQIILYCCAFAYERYAITFFPIRFIIIAMGSQLIYDFIIKKQHLQ